MPSAPSAPATATSSPQVASGSPLSNSVSDIHRRVPPIHSRRAVRLVPSGSDLYPFRLDSRMDENSQRRSMVTGCGRRRSDVSQRKRQGRSAPPFTWCGLHATATGKSSRGRPPGNHHEGGHR
ncbi:hypothetical protein PVAP13_2KG419670 [Panicum virgatum]|uniref:Uncharacterized protein n=1 Tax=Panicum virgatum TaxID=38727 RepID=A0A8T0W9S0_PANVG|nr:hypothetical protein PVAP13_2KG419670 [Panicum virgatum]